MVTPCINTAELFYYQLMHIILKNTELFLNWRPYHVTLCNLLNTVYLHTVHDTHALQGKSDFIPLLSNLLFISPNFIHILHTYPSLQSQYAAIALTTPCTSFMQILLTNV